MRMRGLKALLRRTAPGKLVKTRKYCCYRAIGATNRPVGPKLKGVARRIGETLWSSGEPPSKATWRGGAWQGQGGGLRRGKAVDSQITRMVRAGPKARRLTRCLKLTSIFFAALEHHGLAPVDAQRVVVDCERGLGTAVDVVCTRGDELVLLELKTGYDGDRSAAATTSRGTCHMRGPLRRAKDSTLHRHMAQLAATVELFKAEGGTARALRVKGIKGVSGMLLYICDDGAELHELPYWWEKRGVAILDAL